MIVTLNYYNTNYIGEPVDAAIFQRLSARAEDVISSITRYQYEPLNARLTAEGHTALAAQITTLYKNAICAQIEYYAANDVLTVTAGDSDGGWTVGKVRVDGKDKSGGESRGEALVSPSALMYLQQTGLLNRSISVPDQAFAPWPWGVL